MHKRQIESVFQYAVLFTMCCDYSCMCCTLVVKPSTPLVACPTRDSVPFATPRPKADGLCCIVYQYSYSRGTVTSRMDELLVQSIVAVTRYISQSTDKHWRHMLLATDGFT
jgi:hypothetical protein